MKTSISNNSNCIAWIFSSNEKNVHELSWGVHKGASRMLCHINDSMSYLQGDLCKLTKCVKVYCQGIGTDNEKVL